MFDHEYFKQVDSEMLSALKVLGRAMLSALDALIWYLLLQPIRLYSWLTDDPAPVRRRGAYKNRHCAEDKLYYKAKNWIDSKKAKDEPIEAEVTEVVETDEE